MERPIALAWPPDLATTTFLASASASAKRGSSVQLRCRESAAGGASRESSARWSASVVATDEEEEEVDAAGAGDEGDGDAFLVLVLPLLEEEEEGHIVRAMDGAGSGRDTAGSGGRSGGRGERGGGRGGDRPADDRSVTDADAHRLDDDDGMPALLASYSLFRSFANTHDVSVTEACMRAQIRTCWCAWRCAGGRRLHVR